MADARGGLRRCTVNTDQVQSAVEHFRRVERQIRQSMMARERTYSFSVAQDATTFKVAPPSANAALTVADVERAMRIDRDDLNHRLYGDDDIIRTYGVGGGGGVGDNGLQVGRGGAFVGGGGGGAAGAYMYFGVVPHSPKAEKKSIALLKSWLSPEQLTQFEADKTFIVRGSNTGARYRINLQYSYGVHELDEEDTAIAHYCFTPKGGLALGDIMLAQKIALETDESEALRVANRLDARLPAWSYGTYDGIRFLG